MSYPHKAVMKTLQYHNQDFQMQPLSADSNQGMTSVFLQNSLLHSLKPIHSIAMGALHNQYQSEWTAGLQENPRAVLLSIKIRRTVHPS